MSFQNLNDGNSMNYHPSYISRQPVIYGGVGLVGDMGERVAQRQYGVYQWLGGGKAWLASIVLLMVFCVGGGKVFADSDPPLIDELLQSVSSDSCQATYSAPEQTLSVPCVNVTDMTTGKTLSYAAKMQQVEGTNPLQFAVSDLAENQDNSPNSCQASYSLESGELSLPCITVSDQATGKTWSYHAELQQIMWTQPLHFVVSSLVTNEDSSPSLCLPTDSLGSGELLLPCVEEISPPDTGVGEKETRQSERRNTRSSTKEKIVLVDGISFDKTWQCNENCQDRDNYLLRDLGPDLTSKGVYDTDIEAFRWSGDMITHGENLKTKFRNWFATEVCAEGEACNVSFIAHSWGTIIAMDFIASMAEGTTIKIRTVVTFGSPVTGAQISWRGEAFWQIAIQKVTSDSNKIDGVPAKWVNLVNRQDIVAWDLLDRGWIWDSVIPGIENRQPDGSLSTKGRLGQTFPVSNSELDPIYLGTSVLRPGRGDQAISMVLSSWGISDIPQSVDGIVQPHLPSAYGIDTIVKYVTDRLPSTSLSSGLTDFQKAQKIFDAMERKYPKYFQTSWKPLPDGEVKRIIYRLYKLPSGIYIGLLVMNGKFVLYVKGKGSYTLADNLEKANEAFCSSQCW